MIRGLLATLAFLESSMCRMPGVSSIYFSRTVFMSCSILETDGFNRLLALILFVTRQKGRGRKWIAMFLSSFSLRHCIQISFCKGECGCVSVSKCNGLVAYIYNGKVSYTIGILVSCAYVKVIYAYAMLRVRHVLEILRSNWFQCI